MQRGKSQQSRAQQLNQKNNMERPKPSQSKGKLIVDGPSSSYNQSNKNSIYKASPSLNKVSIEGDKQNFDIFQNIIKIVSSAAEAKEKQILLNLASQIQKQKKIKQCLLSQKETNCDKQQLQAMLVHLRQEQFKDMACLKMEMGKRKLQNLDKRDLKEEILYLNSYVMRRPKKQCQKLRNEGKNLINQIYSKFDEQQKNIYSLSSTLQKLSTKKHIIGQRRQQTISSDEPIFSKTLENPNKQQKQKHNLLKTTPNESSSNNDLMHKILKLEKENLRLMKELSKIEEQFEIVVQEKLILQEKLDKAERQYLNKKMRFQKLIHKFGLLVTDKKDELQICKAEVFQVVKSFKTFLRIQSTKIETEIIRYSQKIKMNDKSQQEQEMEEDEVNQSPEIKGSFESSTNSFERYQTILTQKQIEINNLLKIASKFKQQNQNLSLHIQLAEKQNKIVKKRLLNVKEQTIECLQKIKDFKKVFQLSTAYIHQEIRSFLESKSSIESKCLQLNQILEKYRQTQNKQKNQEILNLHSQINAALEQAKSWERLYSQNKQYHEKQTQKMIQQFTRIENILKSQKNQAIQNLRISIEQINILNKKQIDQRQNHITQLSSKQIEIGQQMQHLQEKVEQLEHEKLQVLKINQQLTQQVSTLLIDVQRLEGEVSALRKQSCQMNINHDKELKKSQDCIANLKNQIENNRDSLIQECGMLIENKIEQINLLKLEIQREKMISEDLHSYILLKADQQKIKDHNRNLKNLNLRKKIELVCKQLVQLKKKEIYLKQQTYFLRSEAQKFVIRSEEDLSLFFKQQKVKALKLESSVFAIDIIKNNRSAQTKDFVEQILSLLQQGLKNLNYQPQLPFQKKLQILKNYIINLHQEAIIKASEESEQKWKNKLFSIGNDQKFQLNDIEAVSPQCQIENTNTEGSSFLQELKPLKFENILANLGVQIGEIINESAILDEVEALRNQLAESFRRSQQLEKQLKLYQQKDMDNIFDF